MINAVELVRNAVQLQSRLRQFFIHSQPLVNGLVTAHPLSAFPLILPAPMAWSVHVWGLPWRVVLSAALL